MKQAELIRHHETLCGTARDLMLRKNNDYSGEDNAFGNLDGCEVVTGGKVSTEMGILVRMQDKISRALNLEVKRINGTAEERAGVDEPFRDLTQDLINYSVLLDAKHDERQKTL